MNKIIIALISLPCVLGSDRVSDAILQGENRIARIFKQHQSEMAEMNHTISKKDKKIAELRRILLVLKQRLKRFREILQNQEKEFVPVLMAELCDLDDAILETAKLHAQEEFESEISETIEISTETTDDSYENYAFTDVTGTFSSNKDDTSEEEKICLKQLESIEIGKRWKLAIENRNIKEIEKLIILHKEKGSNESPVNERGIDVVQRVANMVPNPVLVPMIEKFRAADFITVKHFVYFGTDVSLLDVMLKPCENARKFSIDDKDSSCQETVLHKAAMNGYCEIIEMIERLGKLDSMVKAKNCVGTTPINLEIKFNQIRFVADILNKTDIRLSKEDFKSVRSPEMLNLLQNWKQY